MCRDVNVFVIRQFLQLCALSLTTFTLGIITAFPSVLNPAILAPNSDIEATPDQASWITASLSISGIVGYAIMPAVFEIFGRKVANITTNAAIIIGSIMCYASKDIYFLVFSRLIQGLSLPGMYTFFIGLFECISPKRRGYFMVLNKISLALGALACHSLRFLLHWRQIAIFGALPTCLSMILVIFTVESPSFYALRGEFDKCCKSFEWYRGDSLNAKQELKDLVEAQTEIFKTKQKQKNISIVKKTKNLIMTKDFRKSFYMVTVAKLCLDFCGRYFILVYITQILVEVTNNQSLSMHLSVLCDIITIVALSISYFLVKRFDRRALLFNLGFLSAFLMLIVSLVKILQSYLSLLYSITWLTPSLILIHMFVTNLGLIPLVITVTGEVFSAEHRGVGMFMSGFVFIIFYTIILKGIPTLIEKTGVEGVYGSFGLCLLTLLILLRFMLIETKDKTLQEIEDELKGVKRNESETDLLNQLKVSKC